MTIMPNNEIFKFMITFMLGIMVLETVGCKKKNVEKLGSAMYSE